MSELERAWIQFPGFTLIGMGALKALVDVKNPGSCDLQQAAILIMCGMLHLSHNRNPSVKSCVASVINIAACLASFCYLGSLESCDTDLFLAINLAIAMLNLLANHYPCENNNSNPTPNFSLADI